MFSFFKKKPKAQQLQEKYEKLQEEAFNLSRTNRAESDRKLAEAEEILKEMEALGSAAE